MLKIEKQKERAKKKTLMKKIPRQENPAPLTRQQKTYPHPQGPLVVKYRCVEQKVRKIWVVHDVIQGHVRDLVLVNKATRYIGLR